MAVRKITAPSQYTGLSTDTKPDQYTAPTDGGPPNEGSTFYETDTKATYFYEEKGWFERRTEETPPNPLHAIYRELVKIREFIELNT